MPRPRHKDLAKGTNESDVVEKRIKFEEKPVRVVVTLKGEAATRLSMLADAKHLHKNTVAQELLMWAMKEQGLIPR